MLLAVDKPQGLTSFTVIRALRRELGEKKIGHSGTLDPMATGLMLIATGKDTKKLNALIGLDKIYETTIDFSKKSDTRDLEYREYFEELKKEDLKIWISQQEIEKTLNTLIPSCELPLPDFSAKKRNGERLYDLARKGKETHETKIMQTHAFTILDYQFPLLSLRFEVGSWTYIRSLGHRLGEQLGVGGILTKLRRIRIGSYDLRALSLDKKGYFYPKEWEPLEINYTILEENPDF